MSAPSPSEVLGAMKIVQAFGQEQRETGRFTAAVESVFATAKRRIVLARGHDRDHHLPDVQRDHAGHLARRRAMSPRGA